MKKFVLWLKNNNWNFVLKDERNYELAEELLQRYHKIPDDYVEMLQTFKQCVSGDDKTWFLCEDDYKNVASAYKWNEVEEIELDAARADKDVEWECEIKEWWNDYFPIAFSLTNGYSYYAISLLTGEVVKGMEPEFEDVEVVADSFEKFLIMIIEGKQFTD